MKSIGLMNLISILGLVFLVLFGDFGVSEEIPEEGENRTRNGMTRSDDCEEKQYYPWLFNDCKKDSCERDIRSPDTDPNSKTPVRVECDRFYEKYICVYRFILKGTRGSYKNSIYDYDTAPPNPAPESCKPQVHGHDPCKNACQGWAWAADYSTMTEALFPRAYSCEANGKKFCTCSTISKLRKTETRMGLDDDEN